MSLATAIYERMDSPAPMRSATVTQVSPDLLVDHGAGPVSAVSVLPGYSHAVGDRVTVMLSGGVVWVVGSRASRPQLGTVSTVSGATVTVLADDGRTLSLLPYVGSAPGSGARVALMWGAAGAVVVGALAATPPPAPTPVDPRDPDPSPPPPLATSGTVSAVASEVRTARGGAWRGDGRASRQAYQGHWTSGSSVDNRGYLLWGGALAVPGATPQPGLAAITITRDAEAGMGDGRQVRVLATAASTGGASPPATVGSAYTLGAVGRGATATLPLPDALAAGFLAGIYGGLVLDNPGTAHYLSILGLGATGSRQPLISIPYLMGA